MAIESITQPFKWCSDDNLVCESAIIGGSVIIAVALGIFSMKLAARHTGLDRIATIGILNSIGAAIILVAIDPQSAWVGTKGAFGFRDTH